MTRRTFLAKATDHKVDVLRVIVVVGMGVGVTMCATLATHAAGSPSLWVNGDSLQYGVLAQGLASNTFRPTGCADMTAYIMTGVSPVQTKAPYPGCFVTLGDGGLLSADGMMRLGSVGAVNQIDRGFLGNGGALLPAGITNAKAVRVIPAFQNASQYVVYDYPEKTFVYNVGAHRYYPMAGHDWVMKDPATHNRIEVSAIGISSNGQWAVLAGGGLATYRVNLLNSDVQRMGPAMGSFGGTGIQLAISDDGRYVAVAGLQDGSQLTMYDYDSCEMPADVSQLPSGCSQRDLRPSVAAGEPKLSYVSEPEFQVDSGRLAFYVHVNGENNIKQAILDTAFVHAHFLDYLAMGDSFSSGEGDVTSRLTVDAVGQGLFGPTGVLLADYINSTVISGVRYEHGTDGNADPNLPENAGILTEKEKCHLSKRAYPYQLAVGNGLALGSMGRGSGFRSVACSGSTMVDLQSIGDGSYRGRWESIIYGTKDVRFIQRKQQAVDDFIPGREAQIAFLKRYHPRVATVTLGGNDIGFADVLSKCAPSNTCDYAGADRGLIAKVVQSQYSPIMSTLKAMRQASPSTKLLVVGYPQLAVLDGSCGPNVLLDAQEIEFSHHLINYLNHVIRAAADSSGVRYVDVEDSLVSHGLCSTQPGLSSVNGLSSGEEQELDSFRVIGSESYHPNPVGHAYMAESISNQVGDLLSIPTCPISIKMDTYCGGPSPMPNIPIYFGLSADPIPEYGNWGSVAGAVGNVLDVGNEILVKPVQQSVAMALDVSSSLTFGTAQAVKVEIHSTPTSLGQLRVDADGHAQGTVTLPAGLPLGYHTIHIYGTLITGEQVDLARDVLVVSSVEDADGDGVLDTIDACPFVTPAGVDSDHDGIDDACDSQITQVTDVTAPVVSGMTFTTNPKAVTATTSLSLTAHDMGTTTTTASDGATATAPITATGIAAAEYYLGNADPGRGKATQLVLSPLPAAATSPSGDVTLTGSIGSSLASGVYGIHVRVKDGAGNWSATVTDFLVVYDPAGPRVTAKRSMFPSLYGSAVNDGSDKLPGLLVTNQSGTKKPDPVEFYIHVRYSHGSPSAPKGDVHLSYSTGSNCSSAKKAMNCHELELDATKLDWLAVEGTNGAAATIQGTAVMKQRDRTNAAPSRPSVETRSRRNVVFRVALVDGVRRSPSKSSVGDSFAISIYPATANPNTDAPLYVVHTARVARGSVKIQ